MAQRGEINACQTKKGPLSLPQIFERQTRQEMAKFSIKQGAGLDNAQIGSYPIWQQSVCEWMGTCKSVARSRKFARRPGANVCT